MTVTAQLGAAIEAAVLDIADMTQRVSLNGPEPNYASEKLAHALGKCAEALAVCDCEHDKVLERFEEGWRPGVWLRDPEAGL